MTDAALPDLSLTAVSGLIASRAVSAAEALEATLARIEAVDGRLASYTALTAERARERAAAADAEIARGLSRGPLHGVPVALKDLCDTRFAPTASGMAIRRDHRPARDATVVRRLERAGAVIVGKLTMTEGAFSGHHPAMKTPLNPWGAALWTGASSSGSGAATAAGLCYGALGSDTGGSIRLPSAACGVTGLMPGWGRVSRAGVAALSESLDHVGPMARTALDCAAMLGALAGADPEDPTALPDPVPDYLALAKGSASGLRIGIDRAHALDGLDPAVAAAMDGALEAFVDLGARIAPVTVPDLTGLFEAWTAICTVECAIAHADTWPARAAEYGPRLNAVLETGHGVTALELGRAWLRRLAFAGALDAMFRDCDAMILPVYPCLTPTAEDWMRMTAPGAPGGGLEPMLRYTAPYDMAPCATLTLPGGFDPRGAPVGFQLVGPKLSEATLLRLGAAFQTATGWHAARPLLAGFA